VETLLVRMALVAAVAVTVLAACKSEKVKPSPRLDT
jgi:hypothetical protein